MSVDDAAAIRNAIKDALDPSDRAAITFNSVGKVGDQISGTKTAVFPESLTNKYPLLRNMRYAFDEKNQLLIVDADQQRIVAVV